MNNLFNSADEYRLTSQLFLKLLALIYFAAFLSLTFQITGLVGTNGILPFQNVLTQASINHGTGALIRIPTVFWLSWENWALQGATLLGCLLSLTLLLNIYPRVSLLSLFVLYLSLTHAGQIFLNFQWDYLLLEMGFLSIFLVSGPTRILVFLFHWLLFRLRFMSGVSKLASGDPSWSGLSALQTYFETQPLPHVGAWYAHQLPEWVLQGGVLLTFFAELIVPFFIFLPRRFRIAAALITLCMQTLIIATSNHNFINLLTILLCLFLLDDKIVSRLLPTHWQEKLGSEHPKSGKTRSVFTGVVALLILSSSLPLLGSMVSGYTLPAPISQWTQTVRRFGLGNAYHVFPTMQTERIELQIEGSNDGNEWKAYALPWQPGKLDTPPAFIVPHQPRLDWMIWFVPAQQPATSFWFSAFLQKLQEDNSDVLSLLRFNPFPHDPPRYIRVSAFRYQFTDFKDKNESGNWWKRTYLGQFPYIPPRQP